MTAVAVAVAVAVVGGGAWGTALAALYAGAGRRAVLYARDPATVAAIRGSGRNERFLPGIALPGSLAVTADLGEALEGADAGVILVASPAQSLAAFAPALRATLPPDVPVVPCAVEARRLAVLSGPSFAGDVARGLPTAVALAAVEEALAGTLARLLSAETFRLHATSDRRGVEAGGLKPEASGATQRRDPAGTPTRPAHRKGCRCSLPSCATTGRARASFGSARARRMSTTSIRWGAP